MKLRLNQMRVEPGRLEENFRYVTREIDAARSDGLDGIIFPELCISGYLLGDRWTDESFCRELEACNQELRSLSEDLLLIYGNIAVDPGRRNRDGRMRKYNSCFAWYRKQGLPRVRNGQSVDGPPGLPEGCTVKTLHPDYRFFDDSRYFFSLRDLADEEGLKIDDYLLPFRWDLPGGAINLGLEVCEDLWFGDYIHDHDPLNVSAYLSRAGADLLVNVSASPWTPRKNQARHRRVKAALEGGNRGQPFLYVNCVGTQNNGKNILVFDGTSTVYDAAGGIHDMVEAPFQPAVLDISVSLHDQGLVFEGGGGLGTREVPWHQGAMKDRDFAMLARHLPDCPERGHFLAACEALRSFDSMLGATSPWVIGLSGGIDSSLVVALLACVIDPSRIVGVNMPGQYNSDATRSVARKLALDLGIRWHEIPIGSLVDANVEALADFKPSGFNRENIQAKIRGTSLLSNLAGIIGGTMTNNGNKVEIALGYATLYGDVNGAIAPIGDLLKTEIFALSRFMNQHVFRKMILDESLLPDGDWKFGIAPSAELRPDQVDPMKWGYHDELVRGMTEYDRLSPEQVLSLYLEDKLWSRLGIDPGLVEIYDLDKPVVFLKDFDWFMALFSKGVFKRIQAPPILVMSRSAFGYDFRESQLPWVEGRTIRMLREKILAGNRDKTPN